MSYNGIAVKFGTINPSLVKLVSRLVFLSFTDLSDTGADAATVSLNKEQSMPLANFTVATTHGWDTRAGSRLRLLTHVIQ